MPFESFRSKPTKLLARQYTGDNVDELKQLCRADGYHFVRAPAHLSPSIELWVTKSDRWCLVETGTWIAKESDGHGYYPIVDDMFQKRWERDDDAAGMQTVHSDQGDQGQQP